MPRKALRSPWQFRLVYERGKKVDCEHTVVFYYQREGAGEGPRFGFVASRRVGGAVERNRARRLLREAVRSAGEWWTRGDLWVVLVAKKSILACSSPEVQRDLETGLAGTGLVRTSGSA